MNKIIISFSFALLCSLNTNAQLKVFQNGNTAVKSTATTSNVALSIGNKTYGSDYSVYVSSANPATSSLYNIGSEGCAYHSTAISTGRTIGVRGIAGNCTSGYNYGVVGALQGSNGGAGIYGTAGNALGTGVGGRYAGYFDGDIRVTGAAKAYLANPNDQSVQSFANTSIVSALTILSTLQTKQGTLVGPSINDTLGIRSTNSSSPHYGLVPSSIAQQYPILLIQDANGNNYVNYSELVAVLVQAVKDLYSMVCASAATNPSAWDASEANGMAERALAAAAPGECRLYQNSPNPFNASTVIKYSVPFGAGDAWIYVFDMQGTMLKQMRLDTNADRTVINGSELQPGMYLYSLIVNGKEIDTKRMILSR